VEVQVLIRVAVFGPSSAEAACPRRVVLIRGFDYEGNFISDNGSGPAEFTFSPSL
jgi:hypothetical protein